MKLPFGERHRRVSLQSGLPLVLRNHAPALPHPTFRLVLYLLIKRAMDVVLSAVGIVLLAPFFLLLAASIRYQSPGPALFRQKREGMRGACIDVVKFRSMYSCFADLSGLAQVRMNDARVTEIGRILRRRSLDELPQLLCVLKGEMSLVGPRPHAFGMHAGGMRYDELVPYYASRHTLMKPGITGWAQVNGLRGPTDDARLARMRIDHDLAYVQNYSPWLDIRILARTIWQEAFHGSGH